MKRGYLLQNIKILILALIFNFSISLLYSWTGPTVDPAVGNIPAPINATANSQSKVGSLALGTSSSPVMGSVLDAVGYFITQGLYVSGTSTFNGALRLSSGSPGLGKVLKSDAVGNVSWKTLTTDNTSLDPIRCDALGMAAANGFTINFIFNNGVPSASSPFSTSKCYYINSPSTRVDIRPLVSAGAYVGFLKSINAANPTTLVPVLVSGGISGEGGHFYSSNSGAVVNVSALYIPTGLRYREALSQ